MFTNVLSALRSSYYKEQIRSLQLHNKCKPVHLQLMPTCKCNLDCQWCSTRSIRHKNIDEELSITRVKEVLNQFKSIKNIEITGGGEPLVYNKISKLVNYLLDNNYNLGLVTNGTLLHRLKRINEFNWIRVSLDCTDASSYKEYKGADLFDAVINNISKLPDNVRAGVTSVYKPYVDIDKLKEIKNQCGLDYSRIVFDINDMPSIKAGFYNKYFDDETIIEFDRLLYSEKPEYCYRTALTTVLFSDGELKACCNHLNEKAIVDGPNIIPFKRSNCNRIHCSFDNRNYYIERLINMSNGGFV